MSLAVSILCATLFSHGAEYAAPTHGKIYRLWNARDGNVMYENSSQEVSRTDADIYDMSGRYVGRNVKMLPEGVYIRNNKKFIVK